jgi:hypothetical protein
LALVLIEEILLQHPSSTWLSFRSIAHNMASHDLEEKQVDLNSHRSSSASAQGGKNAAIHNEEVQEETTHEAAERGHAATDK